MKQVTITEDDFDEIVGALEPEDCQDEIADYLEQFKKAIFATKRPGGQ